MGLGSNYRIICNAQSLIIDGTMNGETTTMVNKSINSLAHIYLCKLFTKNSSRNIIVLRNFATNLDESKNAPSPFAFKRARSNKNKKLFLFQFC